MKEDISLPSYIDEDLCDLIQRLLSKDPSERLGVNGYDEVKNHPWFDTIDWDSLCMKNRKSPYIPVIEPDYERIYEDYLRSKSNHVYIDENQINLGFVNQGDV
jgi:serum/glucocorticoid-regulated kinase 2